jgi:hypothetical protein
MNQIFIDGITNLAVHNGVLRVECQSVSPDGKPQSSGTLIIPGPVAAQVLQALIKGTQELQKKIQEARTAPAASS